VVSAAGGPQIYVVLWGSQWSNDPANEAGYLQGFLSHLGGSGDTWSRSTTQYCSGIATGASSCPAGATFVTQISAGAVHIVADNATAAPKRPSQGQLAAEAVKMAGALNVVPQSSQMVIATSHGNNAAGFGSSYCAWHSSTRYGGSYLAYTNLPYIPDAGASCGAGFVANSSQQSSLQGVSIVEGHEFAETVTDPFPNSGWLDQNGAENGDKCAWIRNGQGAAQDVTLNGGQYPVQSLWSNNFGAGGGCVVSYTNSTSQG
jgi:serine protease